MTTAEALLHTPSGAIPRSTKTALQQAESVDVVDVTTVSAETTALDAGNIARFCSSGIADTAVAFGQANQIAATTATTAIAIKAIANLFQSFLVIFSSFFLFGPAKKQKIFAP